VTRVAVVQLDAGRGALAAQDGAVAAVHAAADGGAEVVVLPEYASGWTPAPEPGLAQPLDGPFVTALAAAAKDRGVWVLAGVVAPGRPGGTGSGATAGRAPRARNLAIALDPAGRLRGAYTKVHLFDAFGWRESEALEPGAPDAPPLVLQVGELRLGVLTCYDLRFPEAARRLVDAGASVLCAIAAWASGPGKAEQLRILARARAIENTAYLVLASQSGPGRAAGSAVVDPLGVVVAEAGPDGDDVLLADLDPALVADVRARVPVLEHRRYDVVPRS
jgi:predicted amidohydrolase